MSDLNSVIFTERIGEESFKRLFDLVFARKKANPFSPVTVIAPSQYAGISLRRALAKDRGFLNVKFMTLSRLAEYLGSSDLVENGKTPLTPIIELVTIRHIATESGIDGPLSSVSQHNKLPGLLLRTFSDLSRLDRHDLDKLALTDELRSQLVSWYNQFKAKTQGFYNHNDLIIAAEKRISKGGITNILRDIGHIIFYLPDGLTRYERGLLKALTDTNQATIVLGMTDEKYMDEGSSSIAISTHPKTNHASTGTQQIHASFPDKLLSAPDPREEIRWLVRDIAKRCESLTPFNRIAVLYRQHEPYSSLIPTQLKLADIPISGPNPMPLKSTPSGRLLFGMLSTINSDLSRSTMMQWLSESPVRVESIDKGNRGTIAEWEVISRNAGIINGVDQWIERLINLLDSLTRRISNYEKLDEISFSKLHGFQNTSIAINSLLNFITEFSKHSTLPIENTWGALSKWAKNLLEYYSIPEDDMGTEHLESHQKLLTILEEFTTLDKLDVSCTKKAFLEITEDLLNSPAGRHGETGSGVFVAPLATAKGMNFDTVYIVGMCEGDFPTSQTQDSLLPFEIRETIGNGQQLDSRSTFVEKERREFLSVCALGDQYILSYPRADNGSQRPRFPSAWFMDAVGSLNGVNVSINEIPNLANKKWIDIIQSPIHSLKSIAILAPADIHDRDVASVNRWVSSNRSLDQHYLLDKNNNLSRSLDQARSRQSTKITKWDGDLSANQGVVNMLKQGPLSATGLETWAKCPFSYFLGRVLGLRGIETPEDAVTVSAIDRGSLVHRILERIVAECNGQDIENIDTTQRAQIAERIAEQEFNKIEAEGITGKPLTWATVKEEILCDLFNFIEEDKAWTEEQGLTPIWTEKSFGFERSDSLERLKIPLKDGSELYFRGMIDRVDLSDDKKRIFVTDYKTGSAAPYLQMNKDPLDSGRRLQLPIYSAAVKQAFPEIEQSHGSYWFVTSGANFVRISIDLAEIQERFDEIIENISTGINTGLFPANPGPSTQQGPENCRFCDFDRICPANRQDLWDRKKDDPRLSTYKALYKPPDGAEGK